MGHPVLLQIRGSIKALFPDRDCFTLVRPMHDERALNHLDGIEPEQLRPEFQEVSGIFEAELLHLAVAGQYADCICTAVHAPCLCQLLMSSFFELLPPDSAADVVHFCDVGCSAVDPPAALACPAKAHRSCACQWGHAGRVG